MTMTMPNLVLLLPMVAVGLAAGKGEGQCISEGEAQCGIRFAVVADPDRSSWDPDKKMWRSELLHGQLVREESGNYSVAWGEGVELWSGVGSPKGRSMELSELVYWQGEGWTVCDVTGYLYKLQDLWHDNPNPNPHAHPKLSHQHTLNDGDGTGDMPGKMEWAAVGPDNALYLGSTGKPWKGTRDSEWVKRIDPETNQVSHLDWGTRFARLRHETNTSTPGYLWHEAVEYWDQKGLWVFAPRKESSGNYDEKTDELKGSNLVLTLDPDTNQVESFRIGTRDQRWGWSAIRAVPGDDRDIFAALRVSEVDGDTHTTLHLFDLQGNLYTEPVPVGKGRKFEGIDFHSTE
eukprot:TRINITY_DN5691_c0_g1_i1.p1 TRINITY_DN5691_c0_g1~~TRINITY_DN5691_c0_g1_i1.p1  ORF type:complete len:347 (+),score=72.37 TRINITY_DN5691_c0_g1_i1:237-1277(+)